MLHGPGGDTRVFTIEEANALIPELSKLVGVQLDIGEEIQRLVATLWELVGRDDDDIGGSADPNEVDGHAEVIDITIQPDDSAAVRDIKRSLGESVRRYKAGWERVQDTGAVVKDTNTGLLDFYGRIDDRLVWLCWKYGEDSVEWYHELDAGFAGRKSLAEVRRRMLN